MLHALAVIGAYTVLMYTVAMLFIFWPTKKQKNTRQPHQDDVD